MRKKHAALFNGIGGFQYAAELIGWENYMSCEIDSFCNKVTRYHYPNCIQHEDICKTDFTIYRGKIDVLTGGFPCQDISISGKGAGIFGSKSGLWYEFARSISEILPAFVVIENSPQLLKKGFEKIICDLSEIGYDIEWQCFCASDFGYPHQRERLYALAYPSVQRWEGILHLFKRSIIEKNSKANALDSQCNPFLRFEQRFGESSVLRVDDGLSKRLDVINRLGAMGNAIIPDIALGIFKSIEEKL